MDYGTYLAVKWDVEFDDEFQEEYDALPEEVQDELLAMSRLLQFIAKADDRYDAHLSRLKKKGRS